MKKALATTEATETETTETTYLDQFLLLLDSKGNLFAKTTGDTLGDQLYSNPHAASKHLAEQENKQAFRGYCSYAQSLVTSKSLLRLDGDNSKPCSHNQDGHHFIAVKAFLSYDELSQFKMTLLAQPNVTRQLKTEPGDRGKLHTTSIWKGVTADIFSDIANGTITTIPDKEHKQLTELNGMLSSLQDINQQLQTHKKAFEALKKLPKQQSKPTYPSVQKEQKDLHTLIEKAQAIKTKLEKIKIKAHQSPYIQQKYTEINTLLKGMCPEFSVLSKGIDDFLTEHRLKTKVEVNSEKLTGILIGEQQKLQRLTEHYHTVRPKTLENPSDIKFDHNLADSLDKIDATILRAEHAQSVIQHYNSSDTLTSEEKTAITSLEAHTTLALEVAQTLKKRYEDLQYFRPTVVLTKRQSSKNSQENQQRQPVFSSLFKTGRTPQQKSAPDPHTHAQNSHCSYGL